MCSGAMTILTSDVTININQTRLPVYLAHTPAGTSLKNMDHFAQNVNSERFGKYDYGDYENSQRYGTVLPPEYDLRKLLFLPIVVISGTRDTLCPPEDVRWTIGQLSNVVEHIEIPEYNHLDFIWAKDTGSKVNMKIIQNVKSD